MKPIALFEAFGIEIELMIVDQKTLDVRPWADQLLADAVIADAASASSFFVASNLPGSSASRPISSPASSFKPATGPKPANPPEIAVGSISDYEDGPITWSNELVSHVIEFKTTGPHPTLHDLEQKFHASQQHASRLLAKRGARLMPTGMHPWMIPLTETVIWPHDNNEIYSLYNKIFDCRGHGWSNLQSVHINLPFANENEFKRLHSAIRAILPLIPALSASTPIADGALTRTLDTRLAFYETNQKRLPVIAGDIIPVSITSYDDYREKITNPIQDAIKPFDKDGLLEGDWLNSRGAIARIDRGTIEIRLVDTQECAHADLSIVHLIVGTLRYLINDSDFLSRADAVETKTLHAIYKACVTSAESALISSPTYLGLFGITQKSEPLSAQSLWRKIADLCQLTSRMVPTTEGHPESVSTVQAEVVTSIESLLSRPSLATRIQLAAGPNPSRDQLISIYTKLCDCLDNNELFISN